MTRVWLASYPRSGVTFLRLVLEAMYGVKTYTVYPPRDDAKCLGNLFPLGRAAHKDIPDGDGYAFIKTHEVGHARMKRPAIHLVRDGRDALVSQAHFEMVSHASSVAGLSFNEVLRRLILGILPRAGKSQAPPWNWSEHTKAWAGRTFIKPMRFEDLIVRHEYEAMNAVECVSAQGPDLDPGLRPLPCDVTPLPTFECLQARSPDFFRRGKVGGWRDEMSDELHDLFWEHHGEAMELVGYKRETVLAC